MYHHLRQQLELCLSSWAEFQLQLQRTRLGINLHWREIAIFNFKA